MTIKEYGHNYNKPKPKEHAEAGKEPKPEDYSFTNELGNIGIVDLICEQAQEARVRLSELQMCGLEGNVDDWVKEYYTRMQMSGTVEQLHERIGSDAYRDEVAIPLQNFRLWNGVLIKNFNQAISLNSGGE